MGLLFSTCSKRLGYLKIATIKSAHGLKFNLVCVFLHMVSTSAAHSFLFCSYFGLILNKISFNSLKIYIFNSGSTN
jgi:hypothetical protein